MKKLFLAITFFAFIFATTNAQSLKFGVNGNYIENGSELYYLGSHYDPEFDALYLKLYFLLTNQTNGEIQIEGNYASVEEPFGTESEWCGFGFCWPDNIIDTSVMAAGYTEGLQDELYITVTLTESNEPATYLFNFNVVGDTSDEVHATIHFMNREYLPDNLPFEIGELANDTIIFVSGGIVTTSNDKLTASPKINVYPNPATDNVTFNLGNFSNEKGTLTIYSTAGKVIYKAQGVSGRTQVSVKEFASGIYFYSFEGSEGKATGKLVVK
ncbi:MAG: T9SS type A sorting domain-containing protein [Bacteroidales bacterium]|nr:T9SS type A sorting domain-containing protein [Bacteroidales bacterium]